MSDSLLTRRTLLQLGTATVAGLGLAGTSQLTNAQQSKTDVAAKPVDKSKPTKFQIACMTITYSGFTLERSLTGLKTAGYRYVAWGTTHLEAGGKRVPVMGGEEPVEKARELGAKCRDLGLEPVMMFGPSPEAVEAFKHRLLQAKAAGIGHVLTMGSTKGNDKKLWVKNLKEIGAFARDQGVMVAVKQHGGNTGTGVALAEIVGEVDHPAVKISYDAGNVMDYHKIDPLPDMRKCAELVRSFCIKDHRFFPKDEDCGPGLGEIDHYKLLAPVAFTGETIPLCCENISAPAVPRPTAPEGVDALARRAREFLELVVAGLQA